MDIIERLDSVDWSFPGLSNSGIHSFHWYPATFLSAIPGTLIPVFSKPNAIVLDPFCGSGTTGVEAIRLGRQFVGIDTNPIALLMTEAKLYFPDPRYLRRQAEIVVSRAEALFGMGEIKDHPRADELLSWYHPETMQVLNRLLTAILEVTNVHVRRCLLSVFSGVLKNASSQGKHWGWVCDNVKPKPNEIVFKDAFSIFYGAVNDYAKFTELAHDSVKVHVSGELRSDTRERYRLLGGSCIERLKELDDGYVDFIMTSPPYYGVADYIKSQRLSYLWFDKDELAADNLGFRDFESLRTKEAGARSNRFRKNSHELYMAFIDSLFDECRRVLKLGSYMALVVGESQSRASTTESLINVALAKGFKLALRKERDIKISRRRLMAKVKGEDILIFVKA